MSLLPFAAGFILGYLIAVEDRLESHIREIKNRRHRR